MSTIPPPLEPGQKITTAWLNALRDLVLGGRVRGDGVTVRSITGVNGTTLALAPRAERFWAKLTYHGATNTYSWLEQIPAPAGAWVDGPRLGYAASDPARGSTPADPAYEVNGNAALATGYVTEVSRDRAVARLSFSASACS